MHFIGKGAAFPVAGKAGLELSRKILCIGHGGLDAEMC